MLRVDSSPAVENSSKELLNVFNSETLSLNCHPLKVDERDIIIKTVLWLKGN